MTPAFPQGVESVLFDLDGTLVRTAPEIRDAVDGPDRLLDSLQGVLAA